MPNLSFIRQVGVPKFLARFAIRQVKKRVFGEGTRLALPTGQTLYCPPWSPSASEAYYTGADTDWGSERLLFEHLEPDGVFLDIGAHVGYYALYMAPAVAKVYAFEPDARSFPVLDRNLAPCAHAEAISKAVFSKSGPMQFESRTDAEGFVRVSDDETDTGGATRGIEAVSVDDWMDDHAGEKVTGIKIDIDGFDFEVLQGSTQVIGRDQPLILMEYLETESNSFENLFGFLDGIGYAAFAFHRGDPAPKMKAVTRQTAEFGGFKMIFLTPGRLIPKFAAYC